MTIQISTAEAFKSARKTLRLKINPLDYAESLGAWFAEKRKTPGLIPLKVMIFKNETLVCEMILPSPSEESKIPGFNEAALMSMYCASTEVICCFDAWSNQFIKGQSTPFLLPSEDPNRQDVMIFVHASEMGGMAYVKPYMIDENHHISWASGSPDLSDSEVQSAIAAKAGNDSHVLRIFRDYLIKVPDAPPPNPFFPPELLAVELAGRGHEITFFNADGSVKSHYEPAPKDE